ncbi:hypothetical protein ACHAWF_011045 [Thalassiosira exigua]
MNPNPNRESGHPARGEEETLIPVTAKMVLSSCFERYGGLKGLRLNDGHHLHLVKIVGAVRDNTESAGSIKLEIEDGTGLVYVTLFKNKGDECSAVKAMREVSKVDRTYVRVIGRVRMSDGDGEREVQARDVRPVKSGNEITHHFLEVAYSHERWLERKPEAEAEETRARAPAFVLPRGKYTEDTVDPLNGRRPGQQAFPRTPIRTLLSAAQRSVVGLLCSQSSWRSPMDLESSGTERVKLEAVNLEQQFRANEPAVDPPEQVPEDPSILHDLQSVVGGFLDQAGAISRLEAIIAARDVTIAARDATIGELDACLDNQAECHEEELEDLREWSYEDRNIALAEVEGNVPTLKDKVCHQERVIGGVAERMDRYFASTSELQREVERLRAPMETATNNEELRCQLRNSMEQERQLRIDGCGYTATITEIGAQSAIDRRMVIERDTTIAYLRSTIRRLERRLCHGDERYHAE